MDTAADRDCPLCEPTSMSMNGYRDFFLPADLGMADFEYKISEGTFHFQRSLSRAPVNEWAHEMDVCRTTTQRAAFEDQDLIHSSAVIDVAKGTTIRVPNGPAYHVIQIIDLQNYIVDVLHPGQSRTVGLDDLTYGRHAYLRQCIAPFPEACGGLEAALRHREGVAVDAGSAELFEIPDIVAPPRLVAEARLAILSEIQAGQAIDANLAYGSPYTTTPREHLAGTAQAWGSLRVEDLACLPVAVETGRTFGRGTASSVTFNPPELDADRNGFWSLATYDEDGWLATDWASITSHDAESNGDGSYTINFNAPGEPNNLFTPRVFSAVLRAYAPASKAEIRKYVTEGGKKLVIR